MKKAFISLGILLLLGLGAVYLFLEDLDRYAASPTAPGAGEMILTVRPGQRFASVTDELFRAGLISRPAKFKLIARRTGLDKRVKAGEYLLSPALTPSEVLEKLASGKVRLHRLTIPEGYTLKQIADTVDREGFADTAAFLEAAGNPDLPAQNGIDATSLEGYLFPDTYLFSREVTVDEIVSAMLGRFQEVFSQSWRERAAALGLTVHEVVTLASIIEKETGAPSERPLISSVFHNRLKKGMRLETDPTVIYGVKGFNGNLTRAHLRTPTPYNTYLIPGLPPGPIANPGKAALEAALYPADTKYLFFVSKNDRTHQFSTNFAAHNRAVRKYQLKR